jgi:hypothetical protein
MSNAGTNGFLSLNRSLTNLGDESRRFRLPRMNSFPKLDGRQVRQASSAARRAESLAPSRGGFIIEGQAGSLPEMAADVIDPGVGYATQNVKRDRSPARPWWGSGLGQVVGRMLGSHRAARP